MTDTSSLPDSAFCARMGDIKQDLVEYATEGKLAKEFARFLADLTGGRPVESEEQLIDLVDNFLFEARLPNGKQPVVEFADRAKGLSDEERTTLRRWTEPRLGVFEILSRDDVAFRLYNLVNEVEYRVVPNVPVAELSRIRDGMFVVTAIIPIRDFFTFSGNQRAFRRAEADAARRLAFEMAGRVPRAAFQDNPERLARAWELQRKQHQQFVEHFGADEVVVPGPEAVPRWEQYQAWLRDRRNADRPDGSPPSIGPVPQLPSTIDRATTVGIISDPVEGVGLVLDYGAFLDACRDPDAPNELLLKFLDSPATGPAVFRRATQRFPDTFGAAMARALGRRRFDSAQDLEPLLAERKSHWMAREPIPRVLPVRANRPAAQDRRWRPADGEPTPAPNDPCPCGSGRKFKKCCQPR
jgi:hypothetical protein